MKHLIVSVLFVMIPLLNACKSTNSWQMPVREMTDAQYPDNPNLFSRHPKAQQVLYKTIAIQRHTDEKFDVELIPRKAGTAAIKIKGVPLLE